MIESLVKYRPAIVALVAVCDHLLFILRPSGKRIVDAVR